MTYRKKTLRIFKKDRLWKIFRHIVVLQEFSTVFRFENNYGFSKLTYNGFGRYKILHFAMLTILFCLAGILWVGIGIAQYLQEGVLPKVCIKCSHNAIIIILLF